jgi:hypothetical protein
MKKEYNMEKEFIPYEQSLALKELGFDEQCFSFYDSDGELYESEGYYKKGYNVFDEEVIAPLYQQAFRWFREKYELFHSTNYQDDNSGPGCFDYEICDKRGKSQCGDDDSEFSTYEEAELACLQKLIEIVKTI